MNRTTGQILAVAFLASVLLAGCAHTTAKVNAAGSERGYSSNGEVKVGLPF
jgi:outer membrane murein-binding lipoprotein Lpp